MLKMTKKIGTILLVVVFVALLLAGAGLVFLTLPIAGSNKVLIVLSDSMKPAITSGSIVIAQPATKFSTGDVVSYLLPGTKKFVTHRIVSSQEKNGQRFYQTKGDANNALDQKLVSEKDINGKVILTIPYLGKLVGFAKTPGGLATMVIFPAGFVIGIEIVNIFRELAKKQKVSSLVVSCLPLFLLPVLLVSHSTFAYLSDSGVSSDNTFTAAQTFPGNHLVINEVYYRVALSHRMGSEAQSAWAELYNPTVNPITLASLSLEDNTACDDVPGPVVIPAGGFVIVSPKTESEFRAVWTTVPIGTLFAQTPTAVGNGLANNDELILRNGSCTSGVIIDHISWGSNTNGLNPSIPTVPSDGISSERNPDGVDSDTNFDFGQSNPPTPGT